MLALGRLGLGVVGAAEAVVTADMLNPMVETIQANVGVILPIGLTVFGLIVAVSLIPRLIRRFAR